MLRTQGYFKNLKNCFSMTVSEPAAAAGIDAAPDSLLHDGGGGDNAVVAAAGRVGGAGRPAIRQCRSLGCPRFQRRPAPTAAGPPGAPQSRLDHRCQRRSSPSACMKKVENMLGNRCTRYCSDGYQNNVCSIVQASVRFG
jgi:hypothetical protein